MKNLSMMTTIELFAYADVFNSKISDLVKVGNHVVTVQAYDGLKAEDSQKLLDRIRLHMDAYSDKRNMLNEEISLRVKKNFNLAKGPIELDKMISNMAIEHTVLNDDLEDLKKDFETKMALKKMDSQKKGKKKREKVVKLDT